MGGRSPCCYRAPDLPPSTSWEGQGIRKSLAQVLVCMATESFDVAVIGGGVAGLSAALTLGRARRTVKVIDEGRPRNAPAAHSHGCLTRDGFPPLELVSLGRAEAATYGVEVITDRAHSIERLDSGSFERR